MNYSAGVHDPVTDSRHMPDPYQRPEAINLTPEELRILTECSKEGIMKRAIPNAIIFSIGGFFAGRSGPLCHSKWGPKPAAFGFGLLGYMFGRFTYSKVCLERVMQVPDGTIRKMFPSKFPNDPREEPPTYGQYNTSIEKPKQDNASWNAPASSSDIGLATTSSFDTVPSDYYQSFPEEAEEYKSPQNHVSYDDLRRQNREEFTNKYRVQPQQSPSPPQERYDQRYVRPQPSESQTSDFGKKRTKYGDAWD